MGLLDELILIIADAIDGSGKKPSAPPPRPAGPRPALGPASPPVLRRVLADPEEAARQELRRLEQRRRALDAQAASSPPTAPTAPPAATSSAGPSASRPAARPVQATASAASPALLPASASYRALLSDRNQLRRLIVVQTILGPPRCVRRRAGPRAGAPHGPSAAPPPLPGAPVPPAPQ